MKINWREEIINLFPETTTRTLKENHVWCVDCNGLGLRRYTDSIGGCSSCNGKGQIEFCKCGKERLKGYAICDNCRAEKAVNREIERFNKAEKTNYDDYNGYFLVNDNAYNKDDFEEWLYDKITEGEECPAYVFATKKEKILDIDLESIIRVRCEDGYDDMSEHIDYEGIDKIQEQIDKWIEKQGESAYCVIEDYSKVVLLDKLIEGLIKGIQNRNIKI